MQRVSHHLTTSPLEAVAGDNHLAEAARIQEERRRHTDELLLKGIERLSVGVVVGILAVITVAFPSFAMAGIWYLAEHKLVPLGDHMPFVFLWAWYAGAIIAVLAAFGGLMLIRRGDVRFWRVIKSTFD